MTGPAKALTVPQQHPALHGKPSARTHTPRHAHTCTHTYAPTDRLSQTLKCKSN